MNNLEYSYKVLRENGLTKNLDDYSERWLHKCRSYSRNLRARNEDLPTTAQITLISRLHSISEALSASNVGQFTNEELVRLRDHLSSDLYSKSLSS